MKLHPRAPIAMRCLRVVMALLLALGGAALLDIPARAGSFGIFDPTVLNTNDGQQIFQQICQGCHMPDARGAKGAGYYPALAENRRLASKQYMALTVLTGRRNMPAFGIKHTVGFGFPGASLNNTQIAAVVNYVRTNFGNHYKDVITAEEIESLDAKAH
jgi:mono/diheme cytochrome c family protein